MFFFLQNFKQALHSLAKTRTDLVPNCITVAIPKKCIAFELRKELIRCELRTQIKVVFT